VVKICELEGFGLKLLIGVRADSGGVASVRLLESQVRTHLKPLQFVCCVCCVLCR
jgi:hypothetical protein